VSKSRYVAGWIVLALVSVIMILAAGGKVFGYSPQEVKDQLESYGLKDELMLIATAEAVSAILLLIPRTWSLGVLLVSSYWGGAIVAHLTGNDHGSTVMPAVLLALTWIGSWLRHPQTLSSFTGETHPPVARTTGGVASEG